MVEGEQGGVEWCQEVGGLGSAGWKVEGSGGGGVRWWRWRSVGADAEHPGGVGEVGFEVWGQ